MKTINCIENTTSINLNGSLKASSLSSSPPTNNCSSNPNNNEITGIFHKMELLVENWLNENKDWFKKYAFENLDINTVEKWLRSNNKKICKCNIINSNPNNKSYDKDDDNDRDDPHLAFNLFSKRSNSLSGSSNLAKLNPTVTLTPTTMTNERSLGDSAKFLTSSYDAAAAITTTTNIPTNLFSSCLSTKKVKFFNKDLNKEDPTTTPTSVNKNLAKNPFTNSSPAMHASTLCMSHSHACIIHNRPSSSVNGKQKNNSHIINMMSTSLPFRTEEVNDDDFDDEDNDDNDTSLRKNSSEENQQVSIGDSSFNNISNNHNMNKQRAMPSSPTNKTPINLKRNTFMHKYHPFYACDSTASLNILKMLIESKIKFPSNHNNSNNNTNSAATLNEKIKMKREKKNEAEFLLELVKDISNELNLKSLSTKIINNLKLLVNAEKASLFFVCHPRKCLASFKFDPHAGVWDPTKFASSATASLNYDSMSNDFEMEINFGNTLLGMVAENGMNINIPNASKDKRYNSGIDNIIGYQVKSLLCMPIKNAENEVIAVIQVINKSRAISTNTNKSNLFDENDIKLLNLYLPYCAISIVHAQLFDLYAYEYERNKALLEVVHDLFEQQTNLDEIIFRIMQKSQTLLKCQRCSVLIIMDKNAHEDNVNSRKAFDLFQSGKKPFQRRHSVEDDDGTKISKDLADYVIKTGEKINLSNAYDDPRFDPLVDTIWKFKTKAILCMPIRNRDSNIIGCAQIANRLDGHPFDENDEQLFEAFCIFCGLGINNTLIYDQLEKSMAEKSVALEVLSYHATCPKSELSTFINKYDVEGKNVEDGFFFFERETLSSFVFDDFSLNNDEMVMASYEMFVHSGLLNTFQIDKKTLFQWLLTVRKNYRDIEYHNWNHAFNNSKIANDLQDIEKLGLIVGCLCHDLDHRGTNNMFQVETHSALSQLYGTTGTMEKHHFNHCIMILNTPGHNIFSQMKPRTYALAISYIKEAILATDLADHFSIRKSFDEAVSSSEEPYWSEEPYCSLLRKHLMTCCDLAGNAKPWSIHRDVVNLVTKEFFAQGDRERLELNKEPNEMMDARRSHELPRLQIGWLDSVCLPLYSNMKLLDDSFKGHIKRVEENLQNWSRLNQNGINTSPS